MALFCGGIAAIAAVGTLVLGSMYGSLIEGNTFKIDEYVHQQPSMAQRAQVVLLNRLNVGSHVANKSASIALEDAESPFVPSLRVTSKAGSRAGATGFKAPAEAIVVGTIRMGFGHHRIAYAATSWALGAGRPTYFHDLLNVDSPEAQLIIDMDKLYSKGAAGTPLPTHARTHARTHAHTHTHEQASDAVAAAPRASPTLPDIGSSARRAKPPADNTVPSPLSLAHRRRRRPRHC